MLSLFSILYLQILLLFYIANSSNSHVIKRDTLNIIESTINPTLNTNLTNIPVILTTTTASSSGSFSQNNVEFSTEKNQSETLPSTTAATNQISKPTTKKKQNEQMKSTDEKQNEDSISKNDLNIVTTDALVDSKNIKQSKLIISDKNIIVKTPSTTPNDDDSSTTTTSMVDNETIFSKIENNEINNENTSIRTTTINALDENESTTDFKNMMETNPTKSAIDDFSTNKFDISTDNIQNLSILSDDKLHEQNKHDKSQNDVVLEKKSANITRKINQENLMNSVRNISEIKAVTSNNDTINDSTLNTQKVKTENIDRKNESNEILEKNNETISSNNLNESSMKNMETTTFQNIIMNDPSRKSTENNLVDSSTFRSHIGFSKSLNELENKNSLIDLTTTTSNPTDTTTTDLSSDLETAISSTTESNNYSGLSTESIDNHTATTQQNFDYDVSSVPLTDKEQETSIESNSIGINNKAISTTTFESILTESNAFPKLQLSTTPISYFIDDNNHITTVTDNIKVNLPSTTTSLERKNIRIQSSETTSIYKNDITTASTSTITLVPPTTIKSDSEIISESPEIEDMDPNNSNDSDYNVIIAISVSVVGVIALILLVGFLYVIRKRQKQSTYSQRCRPVSFDDYSLDNVSVFNSVRRKVALRASKRSFGNVAFDDPSLIHNNMTANDLTKFIERKTAIYDEFKNIPQITARADEVPQGCENKNRYANVIPLPETRVILKQINDDERTTYINANYVRGPSDKPNYYIACQAPLENTVIDFWRMIWEQNSKVIIMATDLIEKGIEKCSEYLPASITLDNHIIYGDYQITLKNREVKQNYAVSKLHVKHMQTNESREISHFWYQWPENGVPSDETDVLSMLLEARNSLKTSSSSDQIKIDENLTDKNAKVTKTTLDSSNETLERNKSKSQGPLIVHCSPGTGRTGTLLTIDIAIRIFEATKRVDVPKIVYYVRRGRASAIQTKEQYDFIYRVINKYAIKITASNNDN